MTVWAYLWNQLVLFVESFLEVLDIHFEEAQNLSSRRIQQQGVHYLEASTNDSLLQLKSSILNRLGVPYCWLALLVCTWVSILVCINTWEWTKPRVILATENTKIYLREQYEATTAFWQELSIASQRLSAQAIRQLKERFQDWQTVKIPALKAAARNWMPASS